MYSFIDFIMGPMVVVSIVVFLAGVFLRLASTFALINRTEKFIFHYFSLKYSLRSIFAWLTPFLPVSTRKRPVFYLVSYIFHILLFIVPLFLLSHVAVIEEYFGITWVSFDDNTSDILTLVVIAATLFFIVRRFLVPEVKYLTKTSDFIFILIVALPFITGFLAYHQVFAYKFMVVLHVLSGELMIILIPFTRFFHMFMAPITRAYTGSEFGKVRKAKDW